ncbi:hypothetical protein DASC09_003230 [Saccharomycopsis crataegensis]|uniref:NAD-dependent epimerase/dehydratase domain-containing protein n=1 Tax=Saccharomycopsis crataegensis TaxID=43959 RepID=A0AAV5QFN1_9ASCO|nr:hypothetical protein DASC09_003230 [Saccharomycopsis crataegensis]
MKVFVTGATGWVGTPTVQELIKQGHHVVGLARSDESAQKLKAMGATALRGGLEDINVLKKGAAESDGVIHLGFIHDFANFEHSIKVDAQAIKTICEALEGTNKALVLTSGTLLLSQMSEGVADELLDISQVSGPLSARAHNEMCGMKFANKGVRVSCVRLAPTVHGKGDHGFIPQIISQDKKYGDSFYIGDGQNVWPAVHVLDAAKLFTLALEKAPAGSAFHGVAEEGVRTRDIAQAISKVLSCETKSISNEEGAEKLGFFGMVFSINNPVSSKKTREILGWDPVQIGLIEDIIANYK